MTTIGESCHRERYEEFRLRYGISTVIAVSGGALTDTRGMPGDVASVYKENLDARIRAILHDCLCQFQGYGVAVMTSGTRDGVPRVAIHVAKELKLKLIFLYPQRARKYRVETVEPDLDIQIDPVVGDSQWGDDSALFAQLLDGMIVIGGSTGTLVECAHVFKINETLVDHNKKPKCIIPVRGFAGVSEFLPFFCFRESVRRECMPEEGVWDGIEAGKLLYQHMDPVYQEG
jgi:hypothetical protein